jgi:hypothetical protein
VTSEKPREGMGSADLSADRGTISEPGDPDNRSSWQAYINDIQTPEPAVANTISTERLYISNQVNRARKKKEAEIAAERAALHAEGENPFQPENPSEPDNRSSWETYMNRAGSSEQPMADDRTISTRQLYISNQVNRAREKVVALEQISTLLRSASQSSYSSASVSTWTARDDSDAEPTDLSNSLEVQDKLEHAIHQIEALNARIRELERHRRSAWAQGRSNEGPPPGYTSDDKVGGGQGSGEAHQEIVEERR